MNEEWYHIANVAALDSPAMVVYRERVQQNIDLLVNMVPSSRLRPHVKTHKCSEVCRMMLDAGVTKFKCATIAEAEMLGRVEAPDVLLAYQPVGPKLQRFLSLQQEFPATKFSCLVDNLPTATAVSEEAKNRHMIIAVYLDLNTGMNRSGILPPKAMELWEACTRMSGLKAIGLHAYDGHIYDADLQQRTRRCLAAIAPVLELKKEIVEKGYGAIDIVAGGSPGFPIYALNDELTCSPGTFVYWDHNYRNLLVEQPFQPAAVVLTRIISLPDAHTICTDLGHKSVASENDTSRRVFFLNAPGLTCIGHSEEHLVLKSEAPHQFQVGDLLYGLPFHICPTIALYDRVVVIAEGKAVTEWSTTARDRKIKL